MEDAPPLPDARDKAKPDKHPPLDRILVHEDDVRRLPEKAELGAHQPIDDAPMSRPSKTWPWLLAAGVGLTGLVLAIDPRDLVPWKPVLNTAEQWARTVSVEARTILHGMREQTLEQPAGNTPAPDADTNLDQPPLSPANQQGSTTASLVAVDPRQSPQESAPSSAPDQTPLAEIPSMVVLLPVAQATEQKTNVNASGLPFVTPSVLTVASISTVASTPESIGVAGMDANEIRRGDLTEPDSTSHTQTAEVSEALAEEDRLRQQPGAVDAAETRRPEIEPVPEQTFEPMNARVLFEWNSAEIAASFEPMLAEVIAMLKQSKHAAAEIIGYSDRSGDAVYNLDLSRRRANAVADYLVGQGVPRERLRVDGRGPRDLKTMGKSGIKAAQSLGRMVDVSVFAVGNKPHPE